MIVDAYKLGTPRHQSETAQQETYERVVMEKEAWLQGKLKQLIPKKIFDKATQHDRQAQQQALDFMDRHNIRITERNESPDAGQTGTILGLNGMPICRPATITELWKGDEKIGQFRIELSNGYDGPIS